MKLKNFTRIGTNNTVTITGTSATVEQIAYTISNKSDDLFSGSISHLSGTSIKLNLISEYGDRGGFQVIDLMAGETLNLVNYPITKLGVVVNGSCTIRVLGRLVSAETPQEMALLLSGSSVSVSLDNSDIPSSWTQYDHTDINTATTTTVATPASGKIIKVYKITIAVQSAARPVIQWTNSAGVSADIIGTCNFAGEGFFIYDFGDQGLENPNGVDGLLRVISNNTAEIDVDVISEDV